MDLIRLNRDFYNTFADSFSESRPVRQAGIERSLAVLDLSKVLDVGCGDGRVRRLLPPDCRYTGLDFSQRMIGRRAGGPASFVLADLSQPIPLASGQFAAVVCFAVLHHLPDSFRGMLIGELARMATPDGRVVVSSWQIATDERMQRKVIRQLGNRDYLMSWKRGGEGLRFAHHVDEDELKRLATDANLELEDLFYSDGRSGNLSLYAVLKPA